MTARRAPEGLPVLGRGKHRNPRKGACFMEMASVLADEPWSDAPTCTHPLLAHLARMVNDATSDAHRGDLAVLIPDVVGVRGGGLAWEVSFAAAVAAHAIRHVPEETERALAAGLIRCGELAESLGPGVVAGAEEIAPALASAPAAADWARRFIDGRPISDKAFRTRTAPTVVRCSVRGVVVAAAPYADEPLRDLLRVGIEAARRTPSGVDRSPTPHWRGLPTRSQDARSG
jgi:hypothetical protein